MLNNFIGASPQAHTCPASSGHVELFNNSLAHLTTTQISALVESYLGLLELSPALLNIYAKSFNASVWEAADQAICEDAWHEMLCLLFFPPCDATCQPLLVSFGMCLC